MRIQISFKLVPKGPIENKSALVQIMTKHRTGDKSLPGPVPIQLTETYMRHKGDMS